MPQKKHEFEEVVAKLRQVDVLVSQDRSVAAAVRSGVRHEHATGSGVMPNQFTYYRWRKEFGGLKTDQVKRLKELEKDRAIEAPLVQANGEGAAAEGRVGPHARGADPSGSCLGKLLSPARRRACIDHVRQKFRILERLAYRVLGQHRSTQRKVPRVPARVR